MDPSTIHIKEPPLRAELAQAVLLALELEPSGATFLKPLSLSFHVDSGVPGPQVALVSGTTAEFVPTTIDIDPAASDYIASAEITHFSTVVAGTGNVGVSITNSGDHTVGTPFQLSVTISKIAESVPGTVTLPSDGAFEKTVSAVENVFHNTETFGALTIRPGSFDSSSVLISPLHVDNVPNGPVTIDADSFTFSQTFNCLAAATVDAIHYTGSSEQAVRITSFIGLSITTSVPKTLRFRVRTQPFRCLEPSVTPSPSPSPKPTKSPTPTPAGDPLTEMAGTYDVIRTFDANDCGYTTYTGVGTFRTGEGGAPSGFYFGIDNGAPGLSFMEYRGTAGTDGSFQGSEDASPDNYYAQISGVFSNGTITYTETIADMEEGPCKDHSLTTHGTATKK